MDNNKQKTIQISSLALLIIGLLFFGYIQLHNIKKNTKEIDKIFSEVLEAAEKKDYIYSEEKINSAISTKDLKSKVSNATTLQRKELRGLLISDVGIVDDVYDSLIDNSYAQVRIYDSETKNITLLNLRKDVALGINKGKKIKYIGVIEGVVINTSEQLARLVLSKIQLLH